MNLATIDHRGTDTPVLVDPARGVVPLSALTDEVPADVMAVIEHDRYDELAKAAEAAEDAVFIPAGAVRFTAPYRRPHKIWGIGLNYVDHAADLSETAPDEPASFIKGDHTIIGPGDDIPIPPQSERTTAEGELGLVIGRYCRNVSEEDALDHVFGVTTILDQTAEDILQRNPRFLTRSKNFPGFFSFGPEIVPMAAVLERFGRIERRRGLDGGQRRTDPDQHRGADDARAGVPGRLPQRDDAALPRRHHLDRHARRDPRAPRRRGGVPDPRHRHAGQPGGGRLTRVATRRRPRPAGTP